jgi:hypothetical protein
VTEFSVGDVVRGRFAARPEWVETAIVRGRMEGLWHGDCIEYTPRMGYGTWGYDSEVAEVLRRATQEDELAALSVKQRVSAATDRMLDR